MELRKCYVLSVYFRFMPDDIPDFKSKEMDGEKICLIFCPATNE